jgi:hypothetical protein
MDAFRFSNFFVPKGIYMSSPGREKLVDKNRKTDTLLLRVSPKWLKSVRKRAENEGQSVGAYLRSLALADIAMYEKPKRKRGRKRSGKIP